MKRAVFSVLDSRFFFPWGSLHSIYVLLLESWDKNVTIVLSIYSNDLNSSFNQLFCGLLFFTLYLISIYFLLLFILSVVWKGNGRRFYERTKCFYKVYWFLWIIVHGKFLNNSSPQYLWNKKREFCRSFFKLSFHFMQIFDALWPIHFMYLVQNKSF